MGCATVQDREAQPKSVEAILAEAALANAQLAVAKAVLKAKFRREGATAEEAVEKMATQLVFGRVPEGTKARRRQGKPEVQVLYFCSLREAQEDDGKVVILASEQPVQLAMFAL